MAPESSSGGLMATVLLVEDDDTIGEVLGDFLSLEGFEVRRAADLAGAQAVLEAEPCDLILTDLMRQQHAPVLEAVARLHSTFGSTPTVLVTAHAEVRQWSAEELGLDAVVLQPFDVHDLLATVRRLLERNRERVDRLSAVADGTAYTVRNSQLSIGRSLGLSDPQGD